LIACGGGDKSAAPQPAKKEASADRSAASVEESPAEEKTKAEPFVAAPTAKPPPAPAGALAVPNPWRYVQICNEEHPCPDLLQTEGELHCRDFKLGALHSGWRLPSKSEMGEWGKTEGLNQLEGYHWTRSPFDEDPMQVWIVDPTGKAQSTTIPRKRKPFRVRCVYEP
jgi:hypothetical protein